MKNIILIILAVGLFGVVELEYCLKGEYYSKCEVGDTDSQRRGTFILYFDTIKEVNECIRTMKNSFRVFKLEEFEVRQGIIKVDKKFNYVE